MTQLGPGGTQQTYDFTKSNLVLMIGGQILILAILLMVVFFGTEPLSFPANAVRNMISRNIPKS
jgi:amino acid transporter